MQISLNTFCVVSNVNIAVGWKKKGIAKWWGRYSFYVICIYSLSLMMCTCNCTLIVVKFIQKMASRGRVILCTIHQPSSDIFALFNQWVHIVDY